MKLIKKLEISKFIRSVFSPLQYSKEREEKISICAFNVVKDHIIFADRKVISTLKKLSKHKSIKEALNAMENSYDIEIPIQSKEEHKDIISTLSKHTQRVQYGGNAYYAYLLYKKLFKRCYFYTEGKYIPPASFHELSMRENIIIEYTQNQRVLNKKTKYKSRVILSDRTKDLHPYFIHPPQADIFFLSGYHHIKSRDTLEKSRKSLKQIKGTKCIEISEFLNKKIMKTVSKRLLPYADCIGMNEIESREMLKRDPLAIEEFSSSSADMFPNSAIFIHSQRYMMAYIPKHIHTLNPIEAMSFAQRIDIIKAMHDPYFSKDKIYLNENSIPYVILPIDIPYGIYNTHYHFVYVVPLLRVPIKTFSTGLGDIISSAFSFYIYSHSFSASTSTNNKRTKKPYLYNAT